MCDSHHSGGWLSWPSPAQAQAADATLLIQFNPQAGAAERDALLSSLNAEVVRWLPQIGVVEVRVPAAAAMQRASFATNVVNFIEMDAEVNGAPIFTDPALTDADQGYGLQQSRHPRPGLFTTGAPTVTVAVLDTGINPLHPEFAGKIVPGYDYINNDADPTDDNGHGTHVAGTVAAAGDGNGTIGVCPTCTIMAVKVLNESNSGKWSGVTQGVLFAVDNGAKVINLSLGSLSPSPTMESALAYARSRGVLVVAAAGNNGTDVPYYPASYEGVIGVGAVDAYDTLWPLSNYGVNANLVAPGVRIYSTYHDLSRNGGYVYMTGTSMAAPHVSGVAALLFSFNAGLTADEVTNLMLNNTDDLGDAGQDAAFGHGKVNVYKALVAANGGVTPIDPLVSSNQAAIFLPLVTQ